MTIGKTIFLLFTALICGNSIFAQKELTETEKLATLGKIHGYLKYYHPEVGKGKYDWDKELINHIPKILKATDKESLSRIYNNWIDSLGVIKKCKSCNSNKKYFDKNFDLFWLKDTILFTNELSSKLKYIEKNRNQEENFYVSTEPLGNIKVINEPIYANFEYPNEKYRLLGLFKYWNIIEYFYPYKYLTDQNWDAVLLEMIPKFRTASNKEEYQSMIKELVAKLDDTHAWVKFTNKRAKYLPVKISNIENKAVVSGFYSDSLAKLNNLKLGDVILKVNDLDLKTETEKRSKYVSGSNTNIKTRNTYYQIIKEIDSTTILTILRHNDTLTIEAKRYNFRYLKNTSPIKSKSINDEIGYLNMASVRKEDVASIFEEYKIKKTIIIDLRNYPRFFYWLISNQINPEKRDFTKIYSPNIEYPGKFVFKKKLQTGVKNRKAYKGKVILLVNEESISRSEFTTMAFQTADNVITIGNQTAGADGDVVVFQYLGGFKTAISGNGILYPDGSETQRKGIKIDIEIKPTINGLLQGRDEILEKAIELASQ